jgi:hypothetical protein
VADENDDPVTEETKRRISCMGQIVLYFYYAEQLEDVASNVIPQALPGQAEIFSHKVMKAAVTLGHSLNCMTRSVPTV